jgi:serine-threonine kinase receptor-associated protein
VRTVALSPSASHLLTAGNEKKVRLFDLTRPDAPPSFMKRGPNNEAHDGTIKSVIWDADRAVGVSAGDDKAVRYEHMFPVAP